MITRRIDCEWGFRHLPMARHFGISQIFRLMRVFRQLFWVGCLSLCDLKADSNLLRDPKQFTLSDSDRQHWAFVPVERPEIPEGIASHPIDRFVDRHLEEKGLVGVGAASPDVLLKRVYFDLLGLPPSYEAHAASSLGPNLDPKDFDETYQRVVDALLASPRYGERWGRHWLDVVRYAQTNGYERDDEKPYAWRYRDYVIRAFNEDKPYDEFVREQIAGDELPGNRRDGLVATGFYRLGVWDDEPDDMRQAIMDELDDMVRVTGESFLGLTIGCARCHHHMFDPVSQEDYYSLLAFFRNVRPYEKPQYGPESATYAPLAEPTEVARWEATYETTKKALAALPADATERKKKIENELRATREQPPFEGQVALTLREVSSEPLPTHLMIRGDAGSPGVEVPPAFPVVFGGVHPKRLEPRPPRSTGRRTALANWVADEANPLTARVLVNRVWKHHFGSGLVETANDFGKAGVPPSHPQLLDWLAAELVDHSWSIKHLHRLILTSAAYKRASRAHAENDARDPGNTWLWRQNLRRLEAEVIRDRVLEASGTANYAMGGRGFFPKFAGEVLSGGSRPGRGWGASTSEEENRRSVYAFVKRTMMVPFLEAFDYSNTEGSLGDRSSTTVPTQALMLLNSEFIREHSDALTEHLLEESTKGGTDETLVTVAFRRIMARDPLEREIQLGREFLREQRRNQLPMARQIRFRPEVPASLEREFRNLLPATRFLVGPEQGWDYSKGIWGGGYEGIMVVEPTRGPLALMDAMETGREWEWSGAIRFEPNVESAGLLWGATLAPESKALTAHELTLNFKQSTLTVRRLKDSLVDEVLHQGKLQDLPAWSDFTIADDGEATTITWNDLRLAFPSSQRGRLGLRVWGDGVVLDKMRVGRFGGDAGVWIDENGLHKRAPNAERMANKRALRELSALLFNLNEFVHVD